MGEQQKGGNSRWNWEVAGFEPRISVEQRDDYKKASLAPVAGRRHSLSIASHSELSKHAINSKLARLNDQVKVTLLLIIFLLIPELVLLVACRDCFRI